jgi:hypothetical protein
MSPWITVDPVTPRRGLRHGTRLLAPVLPGLATAPLLPLHRLPAPCKAPISPDSSHMPPPR